MSETIRCRAPRKRPRFEGDTCDGFVADVPAGSRFIRMVEHSREKAEGNTVCACDRCSSLHEIAPPEAPRGRLKLAA
jgi:hypothetical protein